MFHEPAVARCRTIRPLEVLRALLFSAEWLSWRVLVTVRFSSGVRVSASREAQLRYRRSSGYCSGSHNKSRPAAEGIVFTVPLIPAIKRRSVIVTHNSAPLAHKEFGDETFVIDSSPKAICQRDERGRRMFHVYHLVRFSLADLNLSPLISISRFKGRNHGGIANRFGHIFRGREAPSWIIFPIFRIWGLIRHNEDHCRVRLVEKIERCNQIWHAENYTY